MANKSISGLTASASNLASTDVAPVVQTTGVGPVKMTGLQLAGGLLGAASFNGATVTTSQPVLNLSQTWNAGAVTFTGLKFNATDTASAAGSLLLDLQVGGSTIFNVAKSGNLNWSSGNVVFGFGGAAGIAVRNFYSLVVRNNGSFGFVSDGNLSGGTIDTFLTRAAAATLQLGAADAAAPVAQTLQVQSVVAGTSNTAGANWTLKGSAGTGTGAGGSIIFQVAPLGSSGTAQNAYTNALSLDGSAGLATFSGSIINTGDSYLCSHTGASETRGFRVRSTASFSFSSGAASGIPDLLLLRDAANTLALRNGATAQTYRIYATTDSPVTNFQRLTLSAGVTANMAIVAADNGGTGIAMGLQFGAALTTGGGVTNIMNINTSGHLVWNTDNTYDIGASGATRPRSVYAGTGVYAGGIYGTTIVQLTANAGYFDIGGDTRLYRYAASVVRVAGSSSTAGGTLLHNGYTFSTLPTGAAGMVAYISDASNAAPAFGDTVSAGGGTTKVLCWYNGTNWTVIGK